MRVPASETTRAKLVLTSPRLATATVSSCSPNSSSSSGAFSTRFRTAKIPTTTIANTSVPSAAPPISRTFASVDIPLRSSDMFILLSRGRPEPNIVRDRSAPPQAGIGAGSYPAPHSSMKSSGSTPRPSAIRVM